MQLRWCGWRGELPTNCPIPHAALKRHSPSSRRRLCPQHKQYVRTRVARAHSPKAAAKSCPSLVVATEKSDYLSCRAAPVPAAALSGHFALDGRRMATFCENPPRTISLCANRRRSSWRFYNWGDPSMPRVGQQPRARYKRNPFGKSPTPGNRRLRQSEGVLSPPSCEALTFLTKCRSHILSFCNIAFF